MENIKIRDFFIGKICCYLLILLSFFEIIMPGVDIGIFWVSPYRAFIAILLFLFGIYIFLNKGRVILFQRIIRGYFIFLIVWLEYGLFSLLWTINNETVIRNLLYLFINILIIFFLTYYFRREQDFQKLYLLYFSIFIGLLILGFWEHLTGYHLPMLMHYYSIDVSRLNQFIPTGVFYNINEYASFLVLSIPFSIGIFRYGKKLWIRLFCLIITIAAIYLIFIINSRANIFSLLMELVVLFLLLMNLKQKIKLIVISAFCMIILFLFFYGPIQELLFRLESEFKSILTSLRYRSLIVNSITIRSNLIRNGLIFLNSTKGFGIGAGNFEYYMKYFAYYYAGGIINPHNLWLEILVEFGIFIFIGYIILFLGLMLNLYKIYHRNKIKEEKMICEALLVSLSGFIFASISSSSFGFFSFQWLLIGFAFAFLNYSLNKENYFIKS